MDKPLNIYGIRTARLETLKGTVVFFMNQFPPSPRVSLYDRFKFFRKFLEIFASQGAPPVSMTPVTNLPSCQRHLRQILTPVRESATPQLDESESWLLKV